jgi:ligand-binding SRPBCC domain-containing protein
MRKIFVSSSVKVPYSKVVTGFNQQLLEALSPAWMNLRILKYDGQQPGDCFIMQLGTKPFSARWEGKVIAAGSTPGSFWFEDVGIQLPFPLKFWKHRHVIRKSGTGAVIIDIVSFHTGSSLLDWICYPLFRAMFTARRKKYQQYLFE